MRRMRTHALLAALVIVGPAAGCARAPSPRTAVPSAEPRVPSTDALRARLQARLDSIRAGGRFPGATVGVALPDGRVIALATGLADTARRTPMRPADRMLAGSVGKTFVAAVALQLVREGKLSLDDPVARHLGGEPWYPRLPNAPTITVRHLMTHTSGIRRYEFKQAVTDLITREPDHVWTPAERVSFVLGDSVPFAAGEGWDYSDTNYILLGMIVERLAGQDLYALVRRRALEPLGLRNTIPSDRRALPGVVQGYAGPNNAFGGTDAMIGADGRFVVNPQMEWAGGGFASTGEDLARWAKALYEGRLHDSATVARMTEGVPARLGPDVRYGLGVIVRPTRLGTSWGHSGFFPGYQTDVMYWPALKLAVAIQINTSAPRTLGRPMAQMLVELAEVAASR